MTENKTTRETVGSYNRREQLYVRYFTFILIDLVVLNLFDEYWDFVTIESFSISLLTAVLLQVMLKLAFQIEHHIGAHITRTSGKHAKVLRPLAAWALLFGSKFVILGAINFFFGAQVLFSGPLDGLLAFIIVLVVMLAAEMGAEKIRNLLG